MDRSERFGLVLSHAEKWTLRQLAEIEGGTSQAAIVRRLIRKEAMAQGFRLPYQSEESDPLGGDEQSRTISHGAGEPTAPTVAPDDCTADLRWALERRGIYLGRCSAPDCITGQPQCRLSTSASGVDRLICQVWHKAEREQAQSGSPGHHLVVLRSLLKLRPR